VIVVPVDGGLRLITQPDHAALAGRVMGEWRAGGLPTHPRRESILRAVAAHDDGWLEVDAAPLVDQRTGEVLDFVSAPAEVRQAIWPRAVRKLQGDPYAAALVAEHAVFVYSRFRADPDWTPFFDEMERHRDDHLRRAGGAIAPFHADYAFLRLGDLISLAFCNRWSDAQEAFGYTVSSDPSRALVGIQPDPFDGRAVPMSLEARTLPHRRYRDAADAREAWQAAPVVRVSGVARGGSIV
jgi:hypothetical protein